MIKPLILGNTTFPINLIQGPLAGISCSPFRWLTHEWSQPAFTCTEMISCKTLLQKSSQLQRRYSTKYQDEGRVCFQLSGNNPSELAEATKIATDHGADLIDLNCGCPVKKIRGKGAGSRLLSEAKHLYQLISAMKQNTHLPVSIKIRVDGESDEKFNQQIVDVVKESDLDFLVVHGRHWTENYETECRYNDIQFFVDNLTIPVIGNGDIADSASLQAMFKTGCAGVMIARAGVGQPWLIKKLAAEMQGELFIAPTYPEIAELFLQHVSKLADLLQDERAAVFESRQFAKYYARGLVEREAFSQAVYACDNLLALTQICKHYLV